MSSGDDIAVRLVAPAEASLLIALIRSCYGETYVDPSFYHEPVVSELLASQRLHSIGAFTDAGHRKTTFSEYAGIFSEMVTRFATSIFFQIG